MFATTCNMSPASAKVYREAVGRLMDLGELEVIGQDGSRRRSANRIHHDLIKLLCQQQKRFVF